MVNMPLKKIAYSRLPSVMVPSKDYEMSGFEIDDIEKEHQVKYLSKQISFQAIKIYLLLTLAMEI